jgi:hypothetical protein
MATAVVVHGVRGLRGTPGVEPRHAIGEEQLRAFFAQDGARGRSGSGGLARNVLPFGHV